jgi:hypothetical protein
MKDGNGEDGNEDWDVDGDVVELLNCWDTSLLTRQQFNNVPVYVPVYQFNNSTTSPCTVQLDTAEEP